MYYWSIKKNQYWVSAAQRRDCALPNSNKDQKTKQKTTTTTNPAQV